MDCRTAPAQFKSLLCRASPCDGARHWSDGFTRSGNPVLYGVVVLDGPLCRSRPQCPGCLAASLRYRLRRTWTRCLLARIWRLPGIRSRTAILGNCPLCSFMAPDASQPVLDLLEGGTAGQASISTDPAGHSPHQLGPPPLCRAARQRHPPDERELRARHRVRHHGAGDDRAARPSGQPPLRQLRYLGHPDRRGGPTGQPAKNLPAAAGRPLAAAAAPRRRYRPATVRGQVPPVPAPTPTQRGRGPFVQSDHRPHRIRALAGRPAD